MSTIDTPRSPAHQPREAGAWAYSPDVAQTGPADGDGRYAVVDLSAPATPPRILAGPAALVWGAVDGLRDTDAVAAEVAEVVGLSPAEVRTDVEQFLDSLSAEGLLHRTAAPAEPRPDGAPA